MRILVPVFSPTGGTWGGITRVIAVAEAAQRSGHLIAFCASGDLAKKLRAHGYEVYLLPPSTIMGLPKPVSQILERRTSNAAIPIKPGRSFGDIWFVFFISGLAGAGYLKRMVDAQLQAVNSFKPDMLFTDLNLGAFLVARITGLPIATCYQQIMMQGVGSWFWQRVRGATASVLRAYGKSAITPEELCFGPSVLKIVPSIPELDGADPARPDVCYVGQLLGDIQPAGDNEFQSGNKRYVFVYVGMGSVGMETLRTVLPQVFPTNSAQICLVGSQTVQQVERVGAVEFRPYVPAEQVLPHCD